MKIWELVENRCNKNSNSKDFDYVYSHLIEYPSPTNWLEWSGYTKSTWKLDSKKFKFKQRVT
jgi:hypothetical protein